MPETRIVFFQDENRKVPVLSWLKMLRQQDRKGYANCPETYTYLELEESENEEN